MWRQKTSCTSKAEDKLQRRKNAGAHLADAVLKAFQCLVIHTQEGLGCALLGGLVLQAPHAVLVGKALRHHADLGQYAHLRTITFMPSAQNVTRSAFRQVNTPPAFSTETIPSITSKVTATPFASQYTRPASRQVDIPTAASAETAPSISSTRKPGPRRTAHLKPTHGEEQVGVVLGVHRDEGVVPVQGGERARQPVLHVPKGGAAQVDIVLHEAHARVARPALLVVVAHDVLVVGVWVLCQEALDQVLCLFRAESEQDVDLHAQMCQHSDM